MDLVAFAISAFALLILPGPTNAMLVMASQGLAPARMGALLAAVLAAYLSVIVPVSAFAVPYLHDNPAVFQGVKLISATWVLYLALKLWGLIGPAQASGPGFGQLFLTTLLNPKGLIVGLTMLPSRGAFAPDAIVAFLIAAAATSSAWLALGRLILGGQPQMPVLARRCGSAALMAFAAMFTVSTF